MTFLCFPMLDAWSPISQASFFFGGAFSAGYDIQHIAGATYLQYWTDQAGPLLARGISSAQVKGAVHGISILEWDALPGWRSRRHQALAMAVEALRYGMP